MQVRKWRELKSTLNIHTRSNRSIVCSTLSACSHYLHNMKSDIFPHTEAPAHSRSISITLALVRRKLPQRREKLFFCSLRWAGDGKSQRRWCQTNREHTDFRALLHTENEVAPLWCSPRWKTLSRIRFDIESNRVDLSESFCRYKDKKWVEKFKSESIWQAVEDVENFRNFDIVSSCVQCARQAA